MSTALMNRVQALEARIGHDGACAECRGDGRLAIQREGVTTGGCPQCGQVSVLLLVERVPGRYAQ